MRSNPARTSAGSSNDTIAQYSSMTPAQIAHYKVTSKLGEGGMGAVYRATDTKLNRDVAIKVLPPAFAEDAGRMQRFDREAQLLASLNHPNIAQIYGIEAGAIVMELVEGADLAGPLPLDTAIDYARQIAAGLEAAHEKGIVHRDLKPANIKVTPDGVVKILDFGLAKASETSSAPTANSPTLTIGATVAGTILGTAAYMAPEQARGKSVDKRADIWAFGVVLFEMLTGRALFGDGDNTTDIIAAVVTREPDWSALPKGTPPHIRRVLERCLRKDPKLRLRDIGEARLAIDEPQAPASAAVPSIARSGMPLWAVAIPAILALILAGPLWRATRPQESPLRPMMRFSAEVGPESTRQTALPVLISADGTRLVFPIRSAEGGPSLLATRLLDQSAMTA